MARPRIYTTEILLKRPLPWEIQTMSDPVSDPQVPQGPSSAAEASFSLKQVLATAVITLVVSGLGGAFIQSFFSRAAPSIAVTSIAFTGPNEVVKLPESLINASLKD